MSETNDQNPSGGAVAPETPSNQPVPESPQNVYLSFAGAIDDGATTRFSQQLTGLTQSFPPNAVAHLVLQSSGGNVGAAVWLFNFIRTLPRRVIVYNIGTVASAGLTVFLGGHRRIANKNALFMMHRSTVDRSGITVPNLKLAAEYLEREDRRTEAILRDAVPKVPEAVFQKMQAHDVWFNATEAVELGLAHEIGDFAPPFGTKMFYI